MKTKTINLYEYKELSDKAKEKALNEWNKYFDDQYLQVELDNELETLLEQYDIVPSCGTYPKLYYSLSYCQGDGAMFEGTFIWEGYKVYISHAGHYYHYNSKSIELEKIDDEESDIADDVYKSFDIIYVKICRELENIGYKIIEDMQSEESFIEACDANEYTFRENGEMENA